MGKQNGVIQLRGKVGNLVFDKNGGVRVSGGALSENVRNSASYARVRETQREFGGVANMNKAMRRPIAGLNHLWDNRVVGRLASILKKVNLEDGSEARGYRAIQLSKAPRQLIGFEFNKMNSFEEVFKANQDVIVNAARNSATLTTDIINTLTQVFKPLGATHFRVGLSIQSVSDYAWDYQAGKYMPVAPTLDGLSTIGWSDYLPITEPQVPGVSFSLDLPQVAGAAPTMTADTSLVASVSFSLYQKVNGKYYIFEQGQAMKVTKVAVA
jgi:hypothetical protein